MITVTNKTNLLITTTVAVSLLTSTFISPLKANAEAQQSVKSQNFSVDNITYTNDKIIMEDGSEVKYGTNYNIVTDEKKNDTYKLVLDSANKRIVVTNLKNGTVSYKKLTTEVVIEEPSQLRKDDIEIDGRLSSSTDEKNTLSRAAAGPPAGSVDGYKYVRTTKHSLENNVNNATLLIGLMITGGNIAAGTAAKAAAKDLLKPIAAYIIASKLPKVYWKERLYSKSKRINNYDARVYSKTQYNYYKYHDYTSYINTVTKYQTCQPHGCAAPTFKRH